VQSGTRCYGKTQGGSVYVRLTCVYHPLLFPLSLPFPFIPAIDCIMDLKRQGSLLLIPPSGRPCHWVWKIPVFSPFPFFFGRGEYGGLWGSPLPPPFFPQPQFSNTGNEFGTAHFCFPSPPPPFFFSFPRSSPRKKTGLCVRRVSHSSSLSPFSPSPPFFPLLFPFRGHLGKIPGAASCILPPPPLLFPFPSASLGRLSRNCDDSVVFFFLFFLLQAFRQSNISQGIPSPFPPSFFFFFSFLLPGLLMDLKKERRKPAPCLFPSSFLHQKTNRAGRLIPLLFSLAIQSTVIAIGSCGCPVFAFFSPPFLFSFFRRIRA